ncbi:MAG: hypothetical protein HY951_08770 [Bacteroidia bacterium]|nr:hypothetical protein [Bacteroidia bacterium]
MKKIAVIFTMLLFAGFVFVSCNSQEEQAKTEKQILEEMNKSLQEMSTDMSLDTTSIDSTLLK